jgi:hypothetical protein
MRIGTSTPSAVFETLGKQLGVCLTRIGTSMCQNTRRDAAGLNQHTPTKHAECWLKLIRGVEPVRDGVGDGTAVDAELR